MAKPWTCKGCGAPNKRTASPRCTNCGEATKPKLRKRKHRETLDATPYAEVAILSVLIHGGEPHACGCCGKPRPDSGRKWDRDHDHRTGRIRGLACGGNQGCNVLMLPWVSTGVAWAIHEAMISEGRETEAKRWLKITRYLARVETFYANVSVAR